MNETLLEKYESLMLDKNQNPDDGFISKDQSVILRNKQIDEANRIFFELNSKGSQLEKEGNIEEAIEIYEKMVQYATDSPTPYNRLAILYRKQKRYSDEVRILERAIFVYEKIVFYKRSDRTTKLNKFKERLIKVNQLLNVQHCQ